VVTAWNAYTASLEEWRSPKDTSSWLNINGHKQRWIPRVVKPAAPVSAEPPWKAAERAAEAKKREAANEEVRVRREIQAEMAAAVAKAGG
jgi:hypothetical protein